MTRRRGLMTTQEVEPENPNIIEWNSGQPLPSRVSFQYLDGGLAEFLPSGNIVVRSGNGISDFSKAGWLSVDTQEKHIKKWIETDDEIVQEWDIIELEHTDELSSDEVLAELEAIL